MQRKPHRRRVGLFALGKICDAVGEIDCRFRIADCFDCAKNGVGNHERGWLSKPYVLARKNDHPAGDEFRVLAGLNHAREIIEGGVRL